MKEMRLEGKLKEGSKIAVAVSGGKDSLLALYLLNKIYLDNRGISIEAITIDEGISGYREESIRYAKKFTSEYDIPHHIVSFRDITGKSLDEIVKMSWFIKEGKAPCTPCGVLRRFALNKKAREIKADKLATGHNLDDIAQTILMNIFKGDLKRLFRMGPHSTVIDGLVPRSFPLRLIPQTETYLYAYLKGFPIHETECPYAESAHRGLYRDILLAAEDATPGTRHSIIKMYDSLISLRNNDIREYKINICKKCGEPSSSSICQTCRILDSIKNESKNLY